MTNPFQAKISIGIVTQPTCTETTLADFIQKIRSGHWANLVGRVREKFAQGDEPAANALKKQLPAVMVAGTFSKPGNANLVAASGLVCLDFDDIPDPETCKAELANDPHVAAAFASPSGKGLKVVVCAPVATDAEDYRTRVYPAVESYFRTAYAVENEVLDHLPDVSRRCFASHDPAPLVNYEARPVEAPAMVAPTLGATPEAAPSTEGPALFGSLSACADFDQRGDVPALLRRHGWTSDDDVEWTRPHRPGESAPTPKSAEFGKLEHHPRALWVFSTNAAPLEANTGYYPHEIAAMLDHGGDRAATETALRALGFGHDEPCPVPPTAPGEKPAVILPSKPHGLSISESALKLFELLAATKDFFVRGGAVHEIVMTDKGPRLSPLDAKAFRSRMERYARLFVYRADAKAQRKLVAAICPEETASALLVTKEAETLLPPVRLLVAQPCIAVTAAGGLTVLKHGWNPEAGGVYVTGGLTPETVPFSVAVAALQGLLTDFDFFGPGDRSRALASMVTPALKMGGLFPYQTPVEMVEADASQTGKGYLRKLITKIYGETPSMVARPNGGVGSLDELAADALLKGRPFVQFDNLKGKYESSWLEAFLTAEGPFPCRIPLRPTVQVDSLAYTVSLTSNGVELSRDLANRASIIRLKKRPEGYPFRQYQEGDLLEHVEARRAFYLGCVFAVVRAWYEQGRKRIANPGHDFRAWASSLGWIVEHLFQAAPLMQGHNAAAGRTADSGEVWLRAVCLAVEIDGALGTELSPTALAEVCEDRDVMVPGTRAGAESDERARPIGRILKKAFGAESSITREGFRIDRITVPASAANFWKQSFRYVFSRAQT